MTARTLLATAALAALVPFAAFADNGAYALARTGVAGSGPGGGSRYSWNYDVANGYSGQAQSPMASGSASGSPGYATAGSHDHGSDYTGEHDATSVASASLATGTVSASETNSGYDARDGFEYGQPTATIWDQLTFNVAGATAATTSTFDVTFTIHSNLDLLPGSGVAAGGSYVYPTLYVGREARNDFYADYSGSLQVANDNYPTTWDGGVWTTTGSGGDRTFTFTGAISFQGATWSTKMQEALEIYCYNGAECSSSASVAFSLPTSMTMTSESGLFLTAGTPTPSAVPEPQNALLMLGGLAALTATARRRARAARG
jgi:MYXO-CTERM domain-containing protein